VSWHLMDLEIFRGSWKRAHFVDRQNEDGETSLRAYKYLDAAFPWPDFILAFGDGPLNESEGSW
jgi:hypothetical protein